MKKFLFWTMGSLGVILIILLALHFLGPKLINSESIREKIKAGISQKIAGAMDFQKMDVSLFPYPRIVISRVKFSFQETAEGTIDSLIIYPRLFPLLTGKVRIAGIQLDRPHVSLIVPEKERDKNKTPFSAADIEEKLSVFLNTMAANVPDTRIDIEGGSISISAPKRLLFTFQDLDGQIVLPPGEVSIDLTCSSNISKSILLGIRLDPKDFKGIGTLRFAGMKPQLIIKYLFPDAVRRLGDSEGNLMISFKMLGFKDLQAEVQGSLPYLTLLNKNEKISLKGIEIRGAFALNGDNNKITLKVLELEYPRLSLSGALIFNKTAQNVSLELSGSQVDVPSLRNVSLSVAGDVPIVRDIFGYVRGGMLPFITVSSQGASLEDLGKTESIFIKGLIQRGEIFVPGPRLDFKGVNGDCVISKGILEGKNIEGTLGNSRVRDGKLRVGVKGSDPLLHIDAEVKADLSETRNILRRLIKDEPFLKELDNIHTIRGEAQGRVILGERASSIKPRIDLSKVSFTAEYQRLPFPLSIKGGRFSYDGIRVSVKKLSGSMGRSSFAELTGELRLGDDPFVEITSLEARIDQDEVFRWLKSFEELKEPLSEVRSVRGAIDLDTLYLRGPLLKPKEWHFKSTGKIEDIALDWTFLPGTAFLNRGTISANEERISLKDAGVDMLDASVTLSGTREGYLGDRPKTELTFQGEMGPRSLQWSAKLADLPPQISLPDHITFERAHIALKNGNTLFQGKWRVREGPEITADVFKHSKGLVINKLTLNDAYSNAVLSIDLQENELKLAFAGKLSSETLQRVISEKELPGGKIEGDFRTEIQMEKPYHSTAQGKLTVENISLSLKQGVPLKIENISIDADGTRLAVESSALVLDNIPFSLQGGLNFTPENTVIDMDLFTDHIEWVKIAKTIEALGKKEKKATWDLPVTGTLRLKSNYFIYDKYTWLPFQAEIAVHRNDVDIMVNKALLCGIASPGRVNVSPDNLSFNFQITAFSEDLNPVLTCLTGADLEITGEFNFRANVKGQGEKKTLLESVQGNLELIAKDGRIYRAPRLLKILDFLDISHIVRGFPEMRQKGLEYNFIKVKGELRHSLLEVKEGIMDSPSLEMAAEGSIDLRNEKLNMTVLVSPLKRTDSIIRNIPIIGRILGGSVLSVPLRVTGDVNDIKVSFHPVSSVGSGLLGIIERTLETPVKLLEPILPEEKK